MGQGGRKTMFSSKYYKGKITAAFMLAVVLLFFCGQSRGADDMVVDTQSRRKIELDIGKSVVVKMVKPVKRVSIGNPDVADFVVLSAREIHLTGKSAGITNLSLWQNSKLLAIYDLEVSYDVSRLKQKLHEILPEEKDLRVTATHESLTLSGVISSTENLSQALALARAYAPEGKVHNMVKVAGVHQIMLEVRIAEMSRSLVKAMGVNLGYSRGGDFGLSTLSGLTEVVKASEGELLMGPLALNVSPAVNALFRFHKESASWTGFIDALKEDGLVKILAEPTLIALSGKTAEFLAGGEFPVPVPQGLGTVAIEYKPFGVGLNFTPTVLSDTRIHIDVHPEVSELDYSTAVQFEGFVIPGVTTRRATTSVELGDGQSFAIAGLLKESVRETVDKFPLLGDIPVLGALFRSESFQKQETELVIIVTPHLVKPVNMAEQPLPTDFYIEPDDAEFYFLGRTEGLEKQESTKLQGKLDGDFGHAMPLTE
jgi:pilus assembly protein CpaC